MRADADRSLPLERLPEDLFGSNGKEGLNPLAVANHRMSTIIETDTPQAADPTIGYWDLACQTVSMGWFHLRRDETVTFSDELLALCRLPSDQASGSLSDLLMRVPDEERSGIYQTLTAPVGAGSSVGLDFHLVRADGELLTVALRGQWLRSAGGPELRAVIIERPSQEAQRMTDVAQRYRTLTELSPDMIVVHQGGIIVYANPATLKVLRATDPSDVVGHPILDFFTAESRAAFLKRISVMQESQNIAAFFEEQAVALDGTIVDIEATSIPTQWNGTPAFQAIARIVTDRKAADRQLRYQAALIDAVADAIVVYEGSDPSDLQVTSWSRGANTIYGWSEGEARGKRAEELILTDVVSWDDLWCQAVATGAGIHETTHRRRDGTTFPAHVSATLMKNDSGVATGMVTVSTDISRRAEAEAARRELESHYSAVVGALEEGVLVIDANQEIRAANSAAERIFRLRADELIGTTLQAGPWVAVREDGQPLLEQDWPQIQTLRTGVPISNAVVGLVRSGATTWLSLNARPLQEGTTGSGTIVCSVSDISAAKAAQDHLAHAATHDALTGLPNRAGIGQFLRTLDQGGDMAALFVDVDYFKEINDSLGHAAGDQLLRTIADRISTAVRGGTDIVGRLAGDEFVVLCQNMNAGQLADGLGRRLLDSIRQPMQVTDGAGIPHTVSVTVSIGVADLRPDRSGADLLVDADVAMYSAKENGRSQVRVFDETLRERARQRMEIREDLTEALYKGRLRVDYQPIVAPDGEIIAYEALARWDHPTKGMIPPSDFIPVAEENGLIGPLGEWVLDQACEKAKWLWDSGRTHYVAVNLSAKQISDKSLVDQVKRIIAKHALDPRALCFEITESSVMRDSAAAAFTLGALKNVGVRIAIDDFGTGYSSLSYLDRFPVDAVKIDRSFVSMLEAGKARPTLIAGIISLGRSLNLRVVAEGVETPYQAQTLIDLEIDALQGYLFGAPGPL